jgi:hypothetical protein
VFSLLVAISAGVPLFIVWYPGSLFSGSGGDRMILPLVAIDIVIGPLLTLIVFRAGKPGMRFDLVVIGLCRFAAFAHGLHVVLEAHPVFPVLAVDRIIAVRANRLDDADLARGSAPQ